MTNGPPPLFGPDGVRAVTGRPLTPEVIARLGRALSDYVAGQGPVLVGRTVGPASERSVGSVIEGLRSGRGSVIDVGPAPLPALRYAVRARNAAAGAMVTIEHDRPEREAIRLIGRGGSDLAPSDEISISARFEGLSRVEVGALGYEPPRAVTGDLDGYLAALRQRADEPLLRAARPRVVVEGGPGSYAGTLPRLLAHLGCDVTAGPSASGAPNGPRSGPDSVELGRAVISDRALLGIAVDADSDRVSYVDEKGRPVAGSAALALLVRRELARRPNGRVVTSVSSSAVLEGVVKEGGGELVAAATGCRAMAAEVERSAAVFAGEENGEFYWPEHLNAPDGILSSVRMVELVVSEGVPLSDLVDRLPRVERRVREVPLPFESTPPVMDRVRRTLAHEARRLVDLEGVKALYDDGWLLVRPVGDEPRCRIDAESPSGARAAELLERGATLVSDLARAFAYDGGSGDLWCDPA